MIEVGDLVVLARLTKLYPERQRDELGIGLVLNIKERAPNPYWKVYEKQKRRYYKYCKIYTVLWSKYGIMSHLDKTEKNRDFGPLFVKIK